MKRNITIGIGAVALAAIAIYGGNRYMHMERACHTPLMHLPNADLNVCLEPSFSWVYLTFDRPTKLEAFTHAVAQVPGVDVATSRTDDSNKIFRIVYYMSRTGEGEFISQLSSAIDNPDLYENN